MPAILVYGAEILRDAGWLFVLTGLAAASAPRWLRVGAHALWGGLLAWGLVGPLLLRGTLGPTVYESWLVRGGLLLSVTALVLLEQVYRNASPTGRKALRYLVIGLGAVLVYDLFLYSLAEVTPGLSADIWNARGLVNLFAMPLIALAVRRNPE